MKANYNALPYRSMVVMIMTIFMCILAVPATAQQTYTFTTATATGNVGPNQTQINAAYLSTNLAGSVTVTGGIQSFTVPYTGGYRIEAWGASGGASSSFAGGLGARMAGDFTLTAGTVLRILVGQQGIAGVPLFNSDAQQTGGTGGGGSYVATAANVPLVVAGGGGGGSASGPGGGINATGQAAPTTSNGIDGGGAVSSGGTNAGGGLTYNWTGWHGGTGGGGFVGNGINNSAGNTTYGSSNGPGIAFLNGGAGGTAGSSGRNGGFGGGGSSGFTGAGGGGYAGGGAGTLNSSSAGGGGGSWNTGINQSNSPGVNSGNGRVHITELCNISLTSSGPNPLNPSICAGNSLTLTTNAASNYTWSTNNTTTTSIVVSPLVTTNYSVIGTSTANCVAAAFITVIVNSTPPVLSIANPSSNICLGRTVSLTATGALTYTWANPGIVNGQTFTPTSTQVYTVNGQNGCGITSATTTITVAPLPVAVLASPSLVCQGYPSTLTAVASVGNYTWQPGPVNGATITVSPMANVLYTVTASDGTCSGTQTLQVNTKPTPTITVSATASMICQGDAVTLTGNGAGTGGTYSWTPAGGSGQSITMSPNSNTLFTVYGTNSVNCSAMASQAVIVNLAPPLQVSANKTLTCEGGQVNLSASGAGSYNWTGGPSTSGYTVFPSGAYNVYTVVGSHSTNTCTATRTIAIVSIIPSVSLNNPIGICDGGTATLTASGATTYTWNGIAVGATGMLPVQPLATTVYSLIANTQSLNVNCISNHTALVNVSPNPTVVVTPGKNTICKGETHTLTATGAGTYSWSTNATTSVITVNPNSTTIYTVTGTNPTGCKTTVMYQAKVNLCSGINENILVINSVLVYPNPSKGDLHISSGFDVKLLLTNSIGQLVQEIDLNTGNDHTFETRDLAAGVYLLSVLGETKAQAKRIVIAP